MNWILEFPHYYAKYSYTNKFVLAFYQNNESESADLEKNNNYSDSGDLKAYRDIKLAEVSIEPSTIGR